MPTDVIRNQAARFPSPWPNISPRVVQSLEVEPYTHTKGLPSVVIFDLDGTLALNQGTRGWYDWSRVGEDMPNEYVVELLDVFRCEPKIHHTVFLSGRDSVCYDITEKWIGDHVGFWGGDELFMRAEGDQRPDDIVKLELFNNHIRGKYNVSYVVDDRPKVCRMWRKLGLPLLQVGTGEEF